MKGLDLSKFKKVSSDENKTVYKHSDGHFLHVSHKKINEVPGKRIQAFSNGGGVLNQEAEDALTGETPVGVSDPVSTEPTVNDVVNSPNNSVAGFIRNSTQQSFNPNAQEEESQQTSQRPMGTEVNLNSPTAQPAAIDASPMGGLNQMQAGIKNYAAAQGQLGEENAKIITEHDNQMQELQQRNAESDAAYDAEHQALTKDIQDGQIDSNHYFHSMGTGGKVATAIGLILGGFGGANNGGRNMALEAINKNIESDLDAQKANLGKKMNLLGAMERHYGDKLVARNAAHAVQLEAVKNELLKNANKAMTPMAKAQAQQALGQIQMQIDQLGASNKQRLSAVNALQSGNPQLQAAAIGTIVPEKDRAAAMKELNAKTETENLRNQANQAFDKVSNMTLNGTFSPNERQALIEPLAARLEKIGEGRYNHEAALVMANGFFPRKTDMSKQTIETKREELNKFFDALTPTKTIESYIPGISFSKSRTQPVR